MNFTAKEDVEAPIDHVFAEISDFPAFERMAMRRGARVSRIDDLKTPGPGMGWHLGFTFRGRERAVDVEMTEMDAPNRMVFVGHSSGIDGGGVVELVALSPTRTRLKLKVEIKPKTLSARLLVQSLKLAKGNVENRLQLRVADYAADVGGRYTKMA